MLPAHGTAQVGAAADSGGGGGGGAGPAALTLCASCVGGSSSGVGGGHVPHLQKLLIVRLLGLFSGFWSGFLIFWLMQPHCTRCIMRKGSFRVRPLILAFR